jgi:hypothetical protein
VIFWVVFITRRNAINNSIKNYCSTILRLHSFYGKHKPHPFCVSGDVSTFMREAGLTVLIDKIAGTIS